MTVEELELAVNVINIVYPIISGAFVAIVGLLIYIWKTNITRTDNILEQTNKTLSELKEITARHDVEIENNKENIRSLQ